MSYPEITPIAANELWAPGKDYSIDGEYPTPTQDELRDLWQDYAGSDASVINTPGVYGAMCVPNKPPLQYVSVDACEVIRDTNLGIIRAERSAEHIAQNPIKSIHRYGEGCSFEENGADISALAQVLIAADLIEPVKGIEEMSETMQRWRALGAYTILNTSTLPGCETGTIRFLKRHLPGAFDALLLPRNHDSHASMPTKGDVAARLILATEQIVFKDKAPDTQLRRDVTAVHIDDKPCHTIAFRAAVKAIDASVYTVQPMYPSHHELDEGSFRTATPLEAFQLVDTFLRHEVQLVTNS